MQIKHITIIAGLTAALVCGCSKPTRTHDMGSFELVAGTQTNFSLGKGKSCSLVGKQGTNGRMELRMDFYTTNADGTVDHQGQEDDTLQGEQMVYQIWDMTILMKPTVKTP